MLDKSLCGWKFSVQKRYESYFSYWREGRSTALHTCFIIALMKALGGLWHVCIEGCKFSVPWVFKFSQQSFSCIHVSHKPCSELIYNVMYTLHVYHPCRMYTCALSWYTCKPIHMFSFIFSVQAAIHPLSEALFMCPSKLLSNSRGIGASAVFFYYLHVIHLPMNTEKIP